MSLSDELPVLPMGFKWHVARTVMTHPLELQVWREECQPTSDGDELYHVLPGAETTLPQHHKPIVAEPIWDVHNPKLAKAASRILKKLRKRREDTVAIDMLMSAVNDKEDKK